MDGDAPPPSRPDAAAAASSAFQGVPASRPPQAPLGHPGYSRSPAYPPSYPPQFGWSPSYPPQFGRSPSDALQFGSSPSIPVQYVVPPGYTGLGPLPVNPTQYALPSYTGFGSLPGTMHLGPDQPPSSSSQFRESVGGIQNVARAGFFNSSQMIPQQSRSGLPSSTTIPSRSQMLASQRVDSQSSYSPASRQTLPVTPQLNTMLTQWQQQEQPTAHTSISMTPKPDSVISNVASLRSVNATAAEANASGTGIIKKNIHELAVKHEQPQNQQLQSSSSQNQPITAPRNQPRLSQLQAVQTAISTQMNPEAISGVQQPRSGLPSFTTIPSSSQMPTSQHEQPQNQQLQSSSSQNQPSTAPRNQPRLSQLQAVQTAISTQGVITAFFIEESEIRQTLMQYLRPNGETNPIIEIDVPGDKRKYIARQPEARKGSHGLLDWSVRLYTLGYYLDGEFSAENFAVDLLGNLRGRMDLMCLLKKVTADTEEAKKILSNQMKTVANIVEREIHLSASYSQIPADLKHLLMLLRRDEISIPLVLSHVSHDEENSKNSLYVLMYKRLKVLESFDPATYAYIIREIGLIPEVGVWIQSVIENFHLNAVLRFKKNPISKCLEEVVSGLLETWVSYPPTAVGLLDFRRNGDQHLEKDYSLDIVGYLEACLSAACKGLIICIQKQKEVLQLELQKTIEDFRTRMEASRKELEEKHQKLQLSQQQPKQEEGWCTQQRGRRRPQPQLQPQQSQPQEVQQMVYEQQMLWLQQSFEKDVQNEREKHQHDLEELLLKPLQPGRASIMSHVITRFLRHARATGLSKPETMAGAMAGAMYIAAADLFNPMADAAQGSAVAIAAAQLAEATPAQVNTSLMMFTAKDTNHMFDVVAPNLLAVFQQLMFEKGEVFRLSDDVKPAKLE